MSATHTQWGQTGLTVSRLGIGASYGVSTRDVCAAVDQGINFLYWGSARRPRFGAAIREAVAAHGRDRVVVVVQSYARLPFLLEPSLLRALRSLGLAYADVLLLGWWNSPPGPAYEDAVRRLKEKGLIRHAMVSGHQRLQLAEIGRRGFFDSLMVRYNAAHRGAEREVFEPLAGMGRERPGIVAYTATRWGSLLRPVRGMRPGARLPTSTDCYRFCLSHPSVDLVLCGPRNGEELRLAVRALDLGPLDEGELAEMRSFGDLVHGSTISRLPRPWQRTVA